MVLFSKKKHEDTRLKILEFKNSRLVCIVVVSSLPLAFFKIRLESSEGINRKREKLTAQEFERAFDLYYTSVRNFLYYKTSQSDLAEDVAQDAFVKLWETRDKIDKTSIKAYVFTIANNLAINQLKRDQLKFKFLKLQGDKKEIKTPEYLMEMQEFDQKLQDTLAKVPDGAREVFLMNRIDGLKYREIADMLGLSMKAVEKRMSRALAILREEIKEKF